MDVGITTRLSIKTYKALRQGEYKGESGSHATWHLFTPETHHEEDPGRWDDEATVFVGEGLVRLRLSGYGVHPLLLGVFGLKLGAYFVLEDKGQDTCEQNLVVDVRGFKYNYQVFTCVDNVEEMMYFTCKV